MTTFAPIQERVAALQSAYAQAWADRDPAAIAALHTEESVFHTHMGTEPVVGRAAIEASCTELFATYRSFRSTSRRLHLGDAHWVLEWTMFALVDASANGEPVDLPISIDCVDVITLAADTLVDRKDVYLDFAHVTAAMSGVAA